MPNEPCTSLSGSFHDQVDDLPIHLIIVGIPNSPNKSVAHVSECQGPHDYVMNEMSCCA